jgi:transglutaminase-like putative cysteine protease
VMKELVLQSFRKDPRIRDRAISIATGLESNSPVDAAQIIEQYVRNAFTLIDEPEELLIDPTAQMDELEHKGTIHGDCDDVALLTASFLYSIGLEIRFKAISANPDGSYQHVFTEYRLRGFNRWVPVDPTITGIPVYKRGDYIVECL